MALSIPIIEQKSMKILFFIDGLGSGGKERRFVELLKGLTVYKNISCEAVLMNEEVHFKEIFQLNVKIHYLIRKFKKDPTIFLKFYKICSNFKPDIIHCWNPMTTIYALPAAKWLKIKLIDGRIADCPSQIKIFSKTWILASTLHFADVILSNSYAGLKAYQAPDDKSFCIHNGFDFGRIKTLLHKDDVKKDFDLTTRYIVGMVASFSQKKDYHTYLLAAQQILSKRNDVTFIAVGDGPNLDKMKRIVQDSFRERIKFLGQQRNVESIMNVCDIGVLSTYSEGISNTIIEFMALSKPVVASEGGGTHELLIPDKTGFLIPQKNVNTLVDKIELLLNDEDLRIAMGEAGKNYVYKDFSLDQMINGFVMVYNRVVRNKPSSS